MRSGTSPWPSRWTQAQVSVERLQAAGAIQAGQPFDAAICTLGVSVIPDWQRATG
jgi:hypothetical protein